MICSEDEMSYSEREREGWREGDILKLSAVCVRC